MGLSYSDIYDRWQRSQSFGDPRDINTFSKDQNEVTGTNDFDAGVNAGWWTKASHAADVNVFDPVAKYTGLEAAGRAVGGLFGDPYAEVGARAARSLPRTLAQVGAGAAAALIPGVGEVASPLILGGLFGGQTYADTGDPTAAGISGVTAGILPGVSKVAGNLVNPLIADASPFVQKAARFATGQAAQVGTLEGSMALQAKHEGQPFNPLAPDFLAQQIPYTLFDLGRTAFEKPPVASTTTAPPPEKPPYVPPAGSDEASATRDALLERVSNGAKDMNLTPEQRSQMFSDALGAVTEEPSPVTGKQVTPSQVGKPGEYQPNRSPMEWELQNRPVQVTGYAKPMENGNFKVLVTDAGGMALPHDNLWVNDGFGTKFTPNEDGTVTFNGPYKAFSSNVPEAYRLKAEDFQTDETGKLQPQKQPGPTELSRDEKAVLAEVGINPEDVLSQYEERLVRPAVRTADGKISVGYLHADAWERAGEPEGGNYTDGWVTNKGNFLSKDEAAKGFPENFDSAAADEIGSTDAWTSADTTEELTPEEEAGKVSWTPAQMGEGDPVAQLKAVAQGVEAAQVKKADAVAKVKKVPQNPAESLDLFTRSQPDTVEPPAPELPEGDKPPEDVFKRLHGVDLGKSNPAGLRIAWKDAEGKLTIGPKGSTSHTLLMQQVGPENIIGGDPGFVDKQGNFLDRGQARDAQVTARLGDAVKAGATPTQAFEAVRLQQQTPEISDSDQTIKELEAQAKLINRLRRAEPAAGQASGIKIDDKLAKFDNEAEAVGFLNKYTELHPEDKNEYEPREARGKFFLRVKSPTTTVHIEGEPGHSLENVLTVEPQNRPAESFTEFQNQLNRAQKAPIVFAKTAGYDNAVDAVKDLYRVEVVLDEASKGNTILKEINPVLKAQGMDEFETTDDMVSVVNKIREGLDEFAGDMGDWAMGSHVPFDQDLHEEIGLGKPHGLANVLDWVKKNADPNGVIGDLADTLRKYSNFDHVEVTNEPTHWYHRSAESATSYQIWKLHEYGMTVQRVEGGYHILNPDGSQFVPRVGDPMTDVILNLRNDNVPARINVPYLVPNREQAMTWAAKVMHEMAHNITVDAFKSDDPNALRFRASLKDIMETARVDKSLPTELRKVISTAVNEKWYDAWISNAPETKSIYERFSNSFKGDPVKWFSTFYGLLNEKELVAGIFDSPRFLSVLDSVQMRKTQAPVLKFFSSVWAKMFGASDKAETAFGKLISSTDDYLSNREYKGYNAMSYLRDYAISHGVYPDQIASHMDTLKNLYNTGDLEHSLQGFEREDKAGILPATTVSGDIEPTLRQALSSGTPKEVGTAAMNLLSDQVPLHQDMLNNLRGDLNAAQALYKNIKNGSVPGELSPGWEKNVQLNRAKVNALKVALDKQAKAIERWNALDSLNGPSGIHNLWNKSLAGDAPPEPQDPTGVEDVARGALGLAPKNPEYIASERRRIAASGEKPLSWIDRMFKFTSFTSEEVPGFKPVYNTMLETQSDAHRRMTELNTALISDPETQVQSKEIADAYKRVASTDGLNKILSDMLRRAQVLEKMSQPVDLSDPEMQTALRRASDTKGRNGRSDRGDVISAFNSEGNRSQHRVDKVIPEHLSKMVEELTTLSIIGREVGMPFPRAEQLSQQLHTALAQLKDPQTAPIAAESLRAVAAGMKPETFLKVVDQANGFVSDSEKTIQTMQRYRHYIGEQRYGKFQLVMSRDGESYRQGTNTEKEARTRAEELKADGWTLEDIVPKNRANAAQVMGDDPVIRSMQELDQQALNRLESVITDLPPEQQAMLRPLVERAADYQASSAAFSPVPTQASPNRRFSAGRETIDMVANAAEENGKFVNWMRHRESRVRTAAQMLDPEQLANRPLREYSQQFVDNQLAPDNPIARRLAEASFYWYLAGNFGVDFLHSIQSLTTGMASVIAETGGIGDAFKYVGDASVRVTKRYATGKWADANDKWFVNWLTARGGLGLAAWADVFDPTTLNYFKAFGPDSDRGPLAALKKGIRGYKGLFLRHNDMVSGLAGFRLGLDRGMSLEDAARFAEGVKNRGLYSAGKVQRGVGFWSPQEKAIPQLLGALRTYTFGWFSQLGHNWKVGFADAPGEYTAAQRQGAKNAFLYMMGTQAVLAGALGLPGVGQGLALLKQTTGVDLKGVARKQLGTMFGEDQDEYGGFLTGMALHGLVAQFAPFDPSGKHIPNIPFIGVTPYKGFDISSLIPAPFAQASDMLQGLATVAKGGDPSRILPYALHGPIKLLHGGGDIRNSRGELIYPLSTSEKIVTALGLTPSRVAAAKETAATVDEMNKAASQQKSKEVDEVAELTRRGNTNDAQKRLREIGEQNPSYDMRSFVRSVAAQVEKQTVPYNYRRDINPAIDIQGLGNDQPSKELERLQLRQGVQSQLGLYSRPSIRPSIRAAGIDDLMNSDPYMTRASARQRLSIRRPSQYPLSFGSTEDSQ